MNKQDTQRNRNDPAHTDNSMVVSREKGGWGAVEKGTGSQVGGEERRPDFAR